MNEQYYVGTDLKFKIDIKAEGFNILSDTFDITLICGNVEYKCVDSDFKRDGDDVYLLIDTTKFGDGTLQMIVYAQVDDPHFDGFEGREEGYRTEVAKMNLCKLKNL